MPLADRRFDFPATPELKSHYYIFKPFSCDQFDQQGHWAHLNLQELIFIATCAEASSRIMVYR